MCIVRARTGADTALVPGKPEPIAQAWERCSWLYLTGIKYGVEIRHLLVIIHGLTQAELVIH